LPFPTFNSAIFLIAFSYASPYSLAPAFAIPPSCIPHTSVLLNPLLDRSRRYTARFLPRELPRWRLAELHLEGTWNRPRDHRRLSAKEHLKVHPLAGGCPSRFSLPSRPSRTGCQVCGTGRGRNQFVDPVSSRDSISASIFISIFQTTPAAISPSRVDCTIPVVFPGLQDDPAAYTACHAHDLQQQARSAAAALPPLLTMPRP
jgi:hypothetical protein